MTKFLVLLMTINLLLSGVTSRAATIDATTISQLTSQVLQKDRILGANFPEYTQDGRWLTRREPNWLSGFLAGELWLLYKMTGNRELKDRALGICDRLLGYSQLDNTHDMGFIFWPSCVKAYQETGETKYRTAAIQAAEMLLKRFNEQGQFLRAWGKLGSTDRAGLMIIDTMMNLELLFWAYQATGEYRFYETAYRHALTTYKQSLRPDGSSYHVVEFDPHLGKVVHKFTHQGAHDESTWARGQAWGIYGFVKAYYYTHDERFLQAAYLMADYYLKRLPADLIPYWDLSLEAGALRDASAAAIAACGLLELAQVTPERQRVEQYKQLAARITERLINEYLFTSSRRKEEGLLLHTIYHYHKYWGVDESFPAGDYYLVEAIYRRWHQLQANQLIKNLNQRQLYNLNQGWYYLASNSQDLTEIKRADQGWQKIALPHTWNAFDAVDNEPGYRRGIGWYQKELFIPCMTYNQRIVLYFEGVNISSTIYCNDQLAGSHIGGYLGFSVDLTPYLKQDSLNLISVCVDNSYNPAVIPSQKSDFVIFGGITRDVWLQVLPAIFVEKVKISTPSVTTLKAKTKVDFSILNFTNQAQPVEVSISILDAGGKIVQSTNHAWKLSPGSNPVTFALPELERPRLWSPDTPHLYTMQITLQQNRRILDQVSEHYGYRWFEFKEKDAFYLNGKRLLLRGTHRHEDWAGLGNALPDSLHRKDMVMIKAMGANFVRLAHYPQDPEVYKACDELGILVWDELPWCRGGMGGAAWKKNTRRMLQEMIEQNYNHPSIIIWSLGNELDWLPDTLGGDQIDSLNAYLKELNDLAHRFDPGRITALRKFYEGMHIVDLFSPSIWSGWYSGVYKGYQAAIEESRLKYQRFFHAEYGGDSHYGRHTESPVTGEGLILPDEYEERATQTKVKNIAQFGDWSENYIVDLFDWYLQVSEKLPWFSGNAQWAFKDFPTPLRPENPIPYINQKGLLTRDGKPKDAYYVFKSYWTTQPKFCYIESPTWTERRGNPGQPREVCVFSNCQEVELVVNNQSLGKKQRDIARFPAAGLNWAVEFQNGKNQLIARGFDGKTVVCIDTLTINYSTEKTGAPERIELSATRLRNGNFLIEALVVDAQGRRCLDYNRRIYFSAMGSGKLLINYGTPTGSQIIEAANGRAVIEFVPVPGEQAVIEARNQDFKGAYLRLNP